MKKHYLFITILAFLFTPLAFAVDDAPLCEVLAHYYGNCAGTRQVNPTDISPKPKMRIFKWSCGDPQPDQATIDSLTASYTGSKEYYAKRFEWKVLAKAIRDNFSATSVAKFSPQLMAIKDYIEAEEFAKLRVYMDALVSGGTITQPQWDAFNNLIKQQNIDLLDW